MPTSRITIDGLWRCLCPSFGNTTFRRVGPSIAHSAARKGTDLNKERRNYQVRSLHLTSAHFTPPHAPKVIGDTSVRLDHDEPVERIIGVYDKLSISDLHEHWNYLKAKPAKYHDFTFLVDYLVRIRGEKPSLWLYNILIYANADPRIGSAATVKTLLEEMKEQGIGADSALHHTVLQVLAIHPDYILRAQIMQEIKERWIGLSPDGWHSLALGLLRDRQLEVAMEKLQQMHMDGIRVQQWLYDIFLYQLCEADELDEAFKLLAHINIVEQRISTFTPHMWYYLLDTFSKAFHHEGTKYIWYSQVPQLLLKPTDGICVSVLNTAARHGDQSLAIDCMRILSSRSMMLTTYHYEALLGAHVKAGDLYNSFRILSIMAKAGIEPDCKTTRPFFEHLTLSTENPSNAWSILRQLHKDGHPVHISAINVVIESHYFFKRYFEMLQLYKEIHVITSQKPNLETYNILLRTARQLPTDVKAHSMFLASEMRHFGVKPNNITYDRLVLACLMEGDYEDAFKYLAEMVEEGEQFRWWLRDSTAALLTKICARNEDERAWEVFDEHVRRTGRGNLGLKAEIEKAWKGEVPRGRLDRWRAERGEGERERGWLAA